MGQPYKSSNKFQWPHPKPQAQYQWHHIQLPIWKYCSKNSKLLIITTSVRYSQASCASTESVRILHLWVLSCPPSVCSLTADGITTCCPHPLPPMPRPLCQSAGVSLLTPPTPMGTFTSTHGQVAHMDNVSPLATQRQIHPRSQSVPLNPFPRANQATKADGVPVEEHPAV